VGGRDSQGQSREEAWESGMRGITLDAGGLIAVDRNHRRVLALVARATERGMRVTIPATALAQAVRQPAKQARLSRLIRQSNVDVVALNAPDATAVGRLLARTQTSDIVDAHVVLCAERAGQAVLTSDPDDLRRLAPALALVAV
jgi:predicted nucleic acid-binding protein